MKCLVKTWTGEILVENLLIGASFRERLTGLMFKRDLEVDSALFLLGTKQVHTLGMLFPLDLYFFTGTMHLIDSQFHIMPWKMPDSPNGTKNILEIKHSPSRGPLGIRPGEQVSILWRPVR